MNAEAENETQLVHLENKVTKEGHVNLIKVQELIRAMRRRYSTRNNVSHIFKDWDTSSKGYLEPEDIQSMLTKMGLNVNKKEAGLMLAVIDENGDQRVSLNEFLDLVFTHNDPISNMNVDTLAHLDEN